MIVISETAQGQHRQVVEALDQLDDVVFAAIGGSIAALAQLEILWPTIVATLGHELLSESREHYLRRALAIWQECLSHDIERAVTALDVLCVLFAE